jgi:uncharacterized protein YecT (DUF1311 family)
MLRYLLLSLMLASLIAAPPPARADGPAAKDVAAIDACLRRQDGKRGASQEATEAACLMVVAKPCIGDEAAAADRRRIDCLAREWLVWDGMVAQADAAMMAALEPEQRTKLRDMQQAWSRSRELSCGFWYDYFEGTMANPMIASCNNREAARQAIFLRIFAADLAARKWAVAPYRRWPLRDRSSRHAVPCQLYSARPNPAPAPGALRGVLPMAMMLAPLALHDLDGPVASGGIGPGSGGVSQIINPWQWLTNVMGNKFSFFTVNLGRSSAPEVEAEILQNVGSYGRQIGRISDVLEVLVAKLPRENLSDEERFAIEDFSAQMREIQRIKERRGR